MSEAYSLGVDVGGTFTDVVCASSAGRVVTGKAPTTPDDQAEGILNGIGVVADALGLGRRELLRATTSLVHGTTTATNMMLEFNGAKTWMLTTAGFRDVLDFRLNIKEGAFDLRVPPPHPIVPRRRRIPIQERVDSAGTVIRPLDEDAVRAAAERMAEEGAEALAVCFLFSFTRPEHELRARELVRELLPDLHVSLSHEVLPRIREFERFSTTVVDAYVAPRLNRYLTSLERRLRDEGFAGEMLIMKSNGGATEISRARKQLGVELVMSGPAGGAVAAAQLATRVEEPNVITMDMGGTSLDASLIRDYTPHVGSKAWISRHHVGVAVIDVTSVGAGGGSIAWVDDGGALRIGPQSAGAVPGPACYGRGGTLPTVTDADLVLGYLSPGFFLAGRAQLDVEAAHEAIRAHVAEPLGMTVSEAAHAIFRVVSHNMANALRLVSIERGYDPREFALMAFGGGGPVHAGALIDDLGIRRVLVPRVYAPVLCALGDTLADVRESTSLGFHARATMADLAALEKAFGTLVAGAEADMGERALTLPKRVDRAVSMRYVGQTHEVTVPVGDALDERSWEEALATFHRLHAEQFSFSRDDVPVEVIGAQIDRWAFRPKPSFDGDEGEAGAAAHAPTLRARTALFSLERGYEPVAVYDGAALAPGFAARGPAIVQEAHTAIVVYPGQSVALGDGGVYVIEAGGPDGNAS